MKNKIIYSFLLIFTISLLTSAKKINGTCDKAAACSELRQKCSDRKKAAKEDDLNLPSLGIFLSGI